ncbi:MAG: hypothetical protein Q8934_20970 [Bacillota bacterium]|nr:hypothetical protein [Bacillota bacterium]
MRFSLWGVLPKKINASKVVNLVQSNYKSIIVNDKRIEAGTKSQYLIDDFVPRLSRYTLKNYNGELPDNSSYRIDIESKDGSKSILLDNKYLAANNSKYKIIDGTIDLGKFYNLIE